ncbi:MAG: alpha/beta fold hydrolase, partial [Deltaproteobacteria bacterium]|nr:alpha/beta fold hydrolase [Deltaproteobacteria bacterium]
MSEGPGWFVRAIETPRRDRHVDVDGCPIHYLQWGDADRPGIVFVHGGAAHAHWWTFIAPLFLPEYQVVALDLSGHGDSGRRAEYPRELWADEVLAVADDAG